MNATNYLLKRRTAALAITFAITFVPVLGMLGILIAAFMTLVKGVAEGALFLIASILPYFISYAFSTHDAAIPLALNAGVGVAVASNILTWAFAALLKKRMTWSHLIQWAALFGILLVSLIHLAYPDISEWWGSQLQLYAQQASSLSGLKPETTTQVDQLEVINATKQYATGLVTAAILFNALFQLLMARWWEALLYMRGLVRREMTTIRLGQLAAVSFVAAMVLKYWSNSVINDIMPIFYTLFTVAGLSVVHYILFGMPNKAATWLWILGLYFFLVLSYPYGPLALCLLALFDVFYDVRKRIVLN